MGTAIIKPAHLGGDAIEAARISIIIPTLNEANTLPRTLQTLQTATHIEVIVADGGSTDDTCALATAMQAKVVTANAGRASQMNAGATPGYGRHAA
ncbi:MAG: glycosyltransferase, partial [Leptolyngbyaceae cyanobacterium SM2_5_2]|nr:glycosyltransferase [Leptolyngbyaceae cyanobacterium SM2_5_2]